MKAACLKAWRRQAAAATVVLAAVPAMAPVRAADGASAPGSALSPAPALTDLGQALLRQAGGPNAVVSPVATAVALGLVQAGANGAAETEIEALFGGARMGAGALRQTLPALVRQMQGEGNAAASPLTLAARMWVDNAAAAAVPAAYTLRLVSRWQADALRVSFAKSEATRGQINSWTADRTGGRIKDLLPAGSVSAATQMALTSAVYFRSPWEKPFDPAQTVPRPFKTAAGTPKDVPTMVDERAVLQTRIDGYLVLEIPFGAGGTGAGTRAGAAIGTGAGGGMGSGFALLVAVPDEGAATATADAAAPGFSGTQLARWRTALKPLKCELALPRFAIAPQSGSLKAALQGLGVKTVFTDVADLRPMLGRQAKQMHLDDLHHAAGITVDEEGGVAVAAAAATVRSKSLALPVPPCAVDRAFAFALVHQASGAPVFVGRVGDPSRVE